VPNAHKAAPSGRAPRTRSADLESVGRRATSRAHIGQKAEALARDFLIARGYTILAQNLRIGRLEVDLLVRLGPVVAVVEVRTRGPTSFLPALATLSRAKRARLLEAADRLWQNKFANQEDVARIRIDVAAVYLDPGAPRVEYIEGAVHHEDV
jgi:putative endonuclease